MPRVNVKVDDAGWRKLIARLAEIDGLAVKVGVLKEKGSAEHTDNDGPSGITVAELAVIHEFGAPKTNIPERAPIRTTFKRKEREHVELVRKLAKGIVIDRFDARMALEILGQWGANAIKSTIKDDVHLTPKNAQSTIDAKESDRPLVKDAQLANSMTHEITGEDLG